MATTVYGASLCLLDSCISSIVIAPLVIAVWRGMWQLIDIYIYPQDIDLSSAVSLFFGLLFGVLLNYFQDTFHRVLSPKRPVVYYGISRLYTILYAFTCINHWRGVWKGLDVVTGLSLGSGLMTTGIGLGFLILTRGLVNISQPPLLVAPDHYQVYFKVNNQFGVKTESPLFLADVLFTVVFTGTLVVFVWRGVWTALDFFLAPSDLKISSYASLVIGLSLIVLSFMSQIFVSVITRDLKTGWVKIVIENTFVLFSSFGVINMWRAIWYLQDIYLLPENYALSNWLSTALGFVFLIALQCSNSILVRGALLDGKRQDSIGMEFPTEYIRFFIKADKNQDNQKRQEAEDNPKGIDHSDPSRKIFTISEAYNECSLEDQTRL